MTQCFFVQQHCHGCLCLHLPGEEHLFPALNLSLYLTTLSNFWLCCLSYFCCLPFVVEILIGMNNFCTMFCHEQFVIGKILLICQTLRTVETMEKFFFNNIWSTDEWFWFLFGVGYGSIVLVSQKIPCSESIHKVN